MLMRCWEHWIRYRTRPEREALMMLGRQNNILRTGVLKGPSPVIGVPFLAFAGEGLGKTVVVMVRPKMFAVIRLCRRSLDTHSIVIPLGIGVELEKSGLVKSTFSNGAQPGTE
jgi:hypothetical protein